MRQFICSALLIAFMLGIAHADSIHLKNGTIISADKTTEKADQVEYSIGATHYSIPKSSVSSIEHGTTFGFSVGTSKSGLIAPPVVSGPSVSPAGSRPLVTHSQLATALPPAPQLRGVDTEALHAQIISFGKVSDRALYDIQSEGNTSRTSAAYFIAAEYSYQHGDGEAARRYMRSCVESMPEQPALLEWYSVLLLDGGQYQEAVVQAERALEKAPHSADAFQTVGLAYYDSGRLTDAIENWKRAQEIKPSPAIANYLAKAEREAAVEQRFNERDSKHFVLRYEGREAAFRFPSELLSTLDRQYGELQRELGFSPDSTVTVILYTQQQFFDVTQAPSWAGALNDGKLRIPVRDLAGVTPELESVLKHELTHSFIYALTHGRCPTWLNEGLAQMEEPRTSSMYAASLAQLFSNNQQAPLRVLEGSFIRFTPAQAQLAYAESLAATEYLRSTYGTNALRKMLELLSDGEAPEAALTKVTNNNYARFETGLGAYLAKQ